MKNYILGLSVNKLNKLDILEKIKKSLNHERDFFHIVSLNPENLMICQENCQFKKVIETAKIKIVDGVGVAAAAQILNVSIGQRLTGVDLMKDLFRLANERRLRVMLIGGRVGVADKVVDCQREDYPQIQFLGIQGIKDIKNPKKDEERRIFSIVSDFKPHFVFAAFGSPEQELWFDHNKDKFKGCICMGVGGAFDYLSGEIRRAPLLVRRLGLEWLFRLAIQPWRLKRQIRLVKFITLVLFSKFKR